MDDLVPLREQIKQLRAIVTTLQPGQWDKKFVEDMFTRDAATLTENQRNQVRRLAYKYRCQMPRALVPQKVHLPRLA